MLDNNPRGTICIEDIEMGMTRYIRKVITDRDIEQFAAISTDYNPVHTYLSGGSYDVTLVASMKEYIIPYVTCELNKNGHLSHINEKPSYDFHIRLGFFGRNFYFLYCNGCMGTKWRWFD